MNNAASYPKPVNNKSTVLQQERQLVSLNKFTRAIVRKNARYLVTLLNDRKSAP